MVHIDTHDAVTRLQSGKVRVPDPELVTALMRALAATRDARARALSLARMSTTPSPGADLFRLVREGAPSMRELLPVPGVLLRDLLGYAVPTFGPAA